MVTSAAAAHPSRQPLVADHVILVSRSPSLGQCMQLVKLLMVWTKAVLSSLTLYASFCLEALSNCETFLTLVRDVHW